MMVVPVDLLPDYLLNLGLEILARLAAPSSMDAALASMAFMAAYLSTSQSGFGAPGEAPTVCPLSSSARMVGASLHFWLGFLRLPSRGSALQGLQVDLAILLFSIMGGRRIPAVRPPLAVPSRRHFRGDLFPRSPPLSVIRTSARPDRFTRILGGCVGDLGLLPSWLLPPLALL